MELDATTALVIIDVQKAIDEPCWDGKNNPDYQMRVQDLLSIWRVRKWPVFHVKHNEPNPASTYHTDKPTNDFKPETAPLPGEIVIEKEVNCAFIKTSLGSQLRTEGCDKIVFCGVVTHNSIDATVRHASCLGFLTYVVSDACTAVPVVDKAGKRWEAEDVHNLYLGVLDGEYADVITMQDVFAGI
ncbi:cysteine hydrolase family protein [Terasakiella sp. A23]|uniref:cysteine hydrolase family protein n=1 Tax=Terasakiella sp. FCG-A23 TaxID=3080561 RepID=UPI0029547F72|nr:cysteine hydrolase family protein [Terasakiella sp. A23]MDV7340406.1 cysteine hydrolase family protein [Terasakiella sp. A23]